MVILQLLNLGHIQKCLGTSCRKLSVTWKDKILSDGNGFMGAGHLTDLQNQFGQLCFIIVMQMKKKHINFTLLYGRRVGVCGSQINLFLAKINIERYYLYHSPLNLG